MTTTRTPAANRFQPIDLRPDALPMPNQTDKTLAQIRTELLTAFGAADWESYSRLVRPDACVTVSWPGEVVALCNPFPIIISWRPRRAIASESS